MTYDRFRQLWKMTVGDYPAVTDNSPKLIAALNAAATGDDSAFERIIPTYLPNEVRMEFIKRFKQP